MLNKQNTIWALLWSCRKSSFLILRGQQFSLHSSICAKPLGCLSLYEPGRGELVAGRVGGVGSTMAMVAQWVVVLSSRVILG